MSGWSNPVPRFSYLIQSFANPGVNNSINFTVPSTQLWQLISLQFTLTTSATVGSRVPLLQITYKSTTGGFASILYDHATSIAASSTRLFLWNSGWWAPQNPVLSSAITPLPNDTIITPGSIIRCNVDGGLLSGDNITGASCLVRVLN